MYLTDEILMDKFYDIGLTQNEIITGGYLIYKLIIYGESEARFYILSILDFNKNNYKKKICDLPNSRIRADFILKKLEINSDDTDLYIKLYKLLVVIIDTLLFSNNLELRQYIWQWLINCITLEY